MLQVDTFRQERLQVVTHRQETLQVDIYTARKRYK